MTEADKEYRGVTIHYLPRTDEQEEQAMFTLTERTYVNGDKSRVVPENSPEAAFLFGTPGMKISNEEARRLGLLADDADDEPDAEAKQAAEASPEAKQVTQPPEDKAVRRDAATTKGG